jgi:cytochrome b6-f complex iron-sulfur subunit
MFLNWVGIGAVASSLPVAIAACGLRGSDQTSTSGTFKSIGKVSQLDQNGQLLVTFGVPDPVLVVKDASTDTLVAVNPTCTHAGCTVQWTADANRFVCPCHGAQYDIQGQVTRGPAGQPLSSYDVKVEGDQIMVKES